MELVKSDRYEPQSGEGIVREISTNTGKFIPTAAEEFSSRQGLISKLSDSLDMLSGTYNRDPAWQMAAWQKGKDPSTKLGILKGLAADIWNLPKEQINPTILRNHYKALHKLPTDTITENVDNLSFVPNLTGGKQAYGEGKEWRYVRGTHNYNWMKGASKIKLNPGTSELTHPTQIAEMEAVAPWSRTPIHEVTHAMTDNPDNLMNMRDPTVRRYMRELNKISEKKPYQDKSTERIPKEMESWQKSMENSGTPITNDRLKSHLRESIKRERVIQEINERTDRLTKLVKETPMRKFTWEDLQPQEKTWRVKKYF